MVALSPPNAQQWNHRHPINTAPLSPGNGFPFRDVESPLLLGNGAGGVCTTTRHSGSAGSDFSFRDETDELLDDGAGSVYTVLSPLGEGSFATCVKVREHRTGKLFCGKLLPRRKLSASQTKKLRRLAPETVLSLLNCEDEIRIHSDLLHPAIVGFHCWFCDCESGKVCCILDYCRHGTLRNVVDQCPGKILPQEAVQRWMHNLLSALVYLHEAPVLVAHRDINPNNLLVDSSLSIRLSDFGLATRLMPDGKQIDGLRNASVGTLNYIAPEIVLGTESDLRASDVWSAGVVMYEILMGRVPFALEQELEQEHHRLAADDDDVPVNAVLCPTAAELIGAALRREASDRPMARELFSHPFFSAVCNGGNPGSMVVEPGGGGETLAIDGMQLPLLPPPSPEGGDTASLTVVPATVARLEVQRVSTTPAPLQLTLDALELNPLGDQRWIHAAGQWQISEALRRRGRKRTRFHAQDQQQLHQEMHAVDEGDSTLGNSSGGSWGSDLSWPYSPNGEDEEVDDAAEGLFLMDSSPEVDDAAEGLFLMDSSPVAATGDTDMS